MANETRNMIGSGAGLGAAGMGLLTQMYMATGGNATAGGYMGGIAGLLGLGSGINNTFNEFSSIKSDKPDAKMNGIWGGVNGTLGALGSVSSLISTGINLWGDGSESSKKAGKWAKGIGSGLGLLSSISGMVKSAVNYHRQKKALRTEKEGNLTEEQREELEGLSDKAKKKKMDEWIAADPALAKKKETAKAGFKMGMIGGTIQSIAQGSGLLGLGADPGSERQHWSSLLGMASGVGGLYMAGKGFKASMGQKKQADAEKKRQREEAAAAEEIRRNEEEERQNRLEENAAIDVDRAPDVIEIPEDDGELLN